MQKVARLLSKNPRAFSQLSRMVPAFTFSVSELPQISLADDPKDTSDDKKIREPNKRRKISFPINRKEAWRWIREYFNNHLNPDNPVFWLAGWSFVFMVLLGFYFYENHLEYKKISMNVI